MARRVFDRLRIKNRRRISHGWERKCYQCWSRLVAQRDKHTDLINHHHDPPSVELSDHQPCPVLSSKPNPPGQLIPTVRPVPTEHPPSFCPSVCPPARASILPSAHPSVHSATRILIRPPEIPSFHLPIRSSVHPSSRPPQASVHPSIQESVHPSVQASSVHPNIRPSNICPPPHPPVHLIIHLSIIHPPVHRSAPSAFSIRFICSSFASPSVGPSNPPSI